MPPAKSCARGPAKHPRRDEIIAAGEACFQRYGYEKTTVNDLAKKIGFSTSYIYKFFPSKQAIGDMICRRCLAMMIAEIEDIADTPAPASERLKIAIAALARHAGENVQRQQQLQDMIAFAHLEQWPSVTSYQTSLRTALTKILAEGRQTGEFEGKTTLNETAEAVLLVLEPLRNPCGWRERFAVLEQQAAVLSALLLRSLAHW